MTYKYKHQKAVRDYWAKVKREYRVRKKAKAEETRLTNSASKAPNGSIPERGES